MKIKPQKRMAIINDVTGFGRCSVAVAQPIISAMKIQACVLPTAILSAHTEFPSYFFDDYTKNMKAYMENWKELQITFDGICTGFLGSREQIDLVIQFIKEFKGPNTVVIVDPVMGDNGKAYETYTEEMCQEMKRLMKYADVLTPNLTEACKLLDIPYLTDNLSQKELQKIARQLSQKGPRQVVITGLKTKKEVYNFIYEKDRGYKIIKTKRIAAERPGTGDTFTSIVAGSILNGEDLDKAVKKAAKFIHRSLIYTLKLKTPKREGLCFEEFLTNLK